MVAFLSHEKQESAVFIGDNLKYLENRDAARDIYFDVIYIDPPYNTGNNFSYSDSLKSTENYSWIEFMETRLELARDILADDGVIFISIDDSELYELKILMDEIFGAQNFLGNFITRQAERSNSRFINTTHEYVLAYAKNVKFTKNFSVKRIDLPEFREKIMRISRKIKKDFRENGQKSAEKLLRTEIRETGWSWLRNYNMVDENGEIFFAKDLSVPGDPNKIDLPEIGIHLEKLATRKWSSPQKFAKLAGENMLSWKNGRPYEKHFLRNSRDNVSSILSFYSRMGTNDLTKLGLRDLFDTPKPVELVKYLIRIATNEKRNAKILDFFAGSGTTGQAVYEINREDNKNHIFHLVQLDEKIRENAKSANFAKTMDEILLKRLEIFREKSGEKSELKIKKVDDETI
jgi:adenine-specific DNA-methyltransferase